jgi:hypothetical protein
VSGLRRGIGAAADWAVRNRLRLPAIDVGPEHPPWVGRALTDLLPWLALATAAAVLHLIDREWAWLAFALACGAYLLVFAVLPWLVDVARSFVAGYRGDQERTERGAAGPGRSPGR